MQILDIRV